ncbi:hypothetical protein GEMRC1_001689 [Eukaryota sp. GEM-RC1]
MIGGLLDNDVPNSITADSFPTATSNGVNLRLQFNYFATKNYQKMENQLYSLLNQTTLKSYERESTSDDTRSFVNEKVSNLCASVASTWIVALQQGFSAFIVTKWVTIDDSKKLQIQQNGLLLVKKLRDETFTCEVLEDYYVLIRRISNKNQRTEEVFFGKCPIKCNRSRYMFA